MKKSKQKEYVIAGCFDTETSNIGSGAKTRAICVLYIFNDLRFRNLKKYNADEDKVKFFRYEEEFLSQIDDIVSWGKKANVIPVICAYNLMFDMQTIMYDLNQKYKMQTNAQSSTHVYTLDLLDDFGISVLRFWDTYHLEMRGLAAMGETCGLEKAIGSWDYSKIRTAETPLTDEEYYYAARDVQVIPAYLKYLLNANEWLEQNDFGNKVITKTSLVRQMAMRGIGRLKVKKRNGKEMNLEWMFEKTCKNELPKTFSQYALRKACFRGGFTFTAGKTASQVVCNVASLDVTSMHHAFINGRLIPNHFKIVSKQILEKGMNLVLDTTMKHVLENYEKPFACAFHALFEFKNIRLKKGTCFDDWQISMIPSGKFKVGITPGLDIGYDPRNIEMENYIRKQGFHDYAENFKFAFGKLYEAKMCRLYLSEIELWCLQQSCEWDSIEVLFGEMTVNWSKPPDYVTLQSNLLFETKNDAKIINKNYKEGVPYDKEIPSTIPYGIAKQLEEGTCDKTFFESYYNSTVKGMFNGIYGTQAQDVYKPSYIVSNGGLYVDVASKTTEENFDEKQPGRCKVLYTYGLRIVGGSRMHLAIAMILLYNYFGSKIDVTGGDTDSLKIRCDEDITNEMLLEALEPLHIAVRNAIDKTMRRVRELFPNYASDLDGVGLFECEKCEGYERWKCHMEAWNKARISISQDGKPHITCAGLSRPKEINGKRVYNIEDYILDFLNSGVSPEELFPCILGYNVFVVYKLSFGMEHKVPKPDEKFTDLVTDYLGNTYLVNQPAAIALYEAGRMLGDTTKKTNFDNCRYLQEKGRKQNDEQTWLQFNEKGNPEIVRGNDVLFVCERNSFNG